MGLGYSEEVALDEAERCLGCAKKPCVAGCPVNIDIPAFIQQIKAKVDPENRFRINQNIAPA